MQYLRGAFPLSSKTKWKLYDKLERRFFALNEDLQLIFGSDVTKEWLENHNYLFGTLQAVIQKNADKLIPTFQEDFPFRILRGKNKDDDVVYWKEPISPEERRALDINRKIHNPRTTLKGLPTRDRRLLLEVFKNGSHSKIPYGREKAVLASHLKIELAEKTRMPKVENTS